MQIYASEKWPGILHCGKVQAYPKKEENSNE